MPIYEYRCDSCQHIFEELQRYNDPAPEACPQCAEASVRRLISNTTFHLKGSGWYATDNKTSNSGSSSSTSNSAPTGATASADAVSGEVTAAVEPAAATTNTTKIEA